MDTRPSTDFSLILELLSGYMFLIDLGLGISKPADESGNVVSCNRSFTSAFCLSHVVTGNRWKTLYAVTSFPLIFFRELLLYSSYKPGRFSSYKNYPFMH